MAGILYIVPTPVGNLEDMTFRAIRVLKEADLILAEDTRTSSVLLKHYDIKGRLESHHKFNEHKTAAMIKERILAGLNVALISDAGTPGISDPGFLLVRTCAEEGIEVQTLPGATAFVPALVSSGYPCDKFCLRVFCPRRKDARHVLPNWRTRQGLLFSMNRLTGLCELLSSLRNFSVRDAAVLSQGRFPKNSRNTEEVH